MHYEPLVLVFYAENLALANTISSAGKAISNAEKTSQPLQGNFKSCLWRKKWIID